MTFVNHETPRYSPDPLDDDPMKIMRLDLRTIILRSCLFKLFHRIVLHFAHEYRMWLVGFSSELFRNIEHLKTYETSDRSRPPFCPHEVQHMVVQSLLLVWPFAAEFLVLTFAESSRFSVESQFPSFAPRTRVALFCLCEVRTCTRHPFSSVWQSHAGPQKYISVAQSQFKYLQVTHSSQIYSPFRSDKLYLTLLINDESFSSYTLFRQPQRWPWHCR